MGKKSLTNELLNKIEAYIDGMHYLSNCGSPFDESKFKKLDHMLEKADVAFGPAKRAEMMDDIKKILPVKTDDGWRDGRESLRLNLMNGLTQGFETFNKVLMETSPDQSTAKKMMKILNKYK
ncbi:MAG: hypothetical protein KGD74_03385 [Candidatus Lokiarchaeota archaeon]|nr:hypothetical protein [Candidatus Lokiarchaeota archaeon]